MPKFKIKTLGCKVNQYESEAIGKELQTSGWHAVQTEAPSDLCIINTCTVTRKAAMQSRQAVRQAIKANPGARIVVTGCYAQTEADELKKIDGVHDIIGHTQKHQIGSMFTSRNALKETSRVTVCSDIENETRFKPFSETVFGTRTRPFLKIQDGCNAYCSYCIVPFARGPSRSMALDDVLDHIRQLKSAGYHEVVLTGVHLGNYGIDLTPKTSLYHVLHQIDKSNLIQRVRLSSIEPLELSNGILKLVSTSPRFCRHFHIPLQSGDDDLLKKMRRPYTRNFFHDLVVKIIDGIPDAAVGVDVLVGFPGETDGAFENTYNLIRVLPVAYLHVFPFSARSGTPASTFDDQIPPDVIKARCARMRNLGDEKRRMFYQGFIGHTLDALIEETRDNKTGFLKGISSNYIPVLVDAPDDHQNTIVPVRIKKISEASQPLGTICQQI